MTDAKKIVRIIGKGTMKKPTLVMVQYQTKRSESQGERAGSEMYSIHDAECRDLPRDLRDHDGFKIPVKDLEDTIKRFKYAGLKVHPCCKAGKLTGYHQGEEE